MPHDDSPFRWRFWLGWTLATSAGWAVAANLLSIANTCWNSTNSYWEALIVSGGLVLGGGSVLALAQWLCLRRDCRQAGRWIVVKVSTWGIMFAVVNILSLLLNVAIFDTMHINRPMLVGICVAAVGAVFLPGVIEWLFFRRRMEQAGWWVPISFMSYCVIAVLAIPVGTVGKGLYSACYIEDVYRSTSYTCHGGPYHKSPLCLWMPVIIHLIPTAIGIGVGFVRGSLTGLLPAWLLPVMQSARSIKKPRTEGVVL